MSQYNSSVLHRGTFCGKPTIGKRIEWDEVAIKQFDKDGMITEMCICARNWNLRLDLVLNLNELLKNEISKKNNNSHITGYNIQYNYGTE